MYTTCLPDLGSLSIRSTRVLVQSMEPLVFSVICETYGGPVTSVTWTRDSVEVEGGVSVITNTRLDYYTNHLNATKEGVYRVVLRNNKPSSVVRTLNLTGECYIIVSLVSPLTFSHPVPHPPSNFSVIQTGLQRVNTIWKAPPQEVTFSSTIHL